MKSKEIKFVVYQNRICGFLLQNTYSSSYSSHNCVFKNDFFSPELPPLGNPKSHYHDSKPTRIQNSN